jgi:hypothetical protein
MVTSHELLLALMGGLVRKMLSLPLYALEEPGANEQSNTFG